MDEKQINLVCWLYNFSKIEMELRNDEHSKTDVLHLEKAIKKRFPDYCDQIIKEYMEVK